MITGLHAIVYSPAADSVRAFLRDILGLPSVDGGGGWPIFAAPPTELAVHPAADSRHELYLVCDDLDATVLELRRKGVAITRQISEQRWGRVTAIRLPDDSELMLYQPSHPRPTTQPD